jgi:hypothetical protein
MIGYLKILTSIIKSQKIYLDIQGILDYIEYNKCGRGVMVAARDLKSCGVIRAGSSPAARTMVP